MERRIVRVADLGSREYREALELQRTIAAARRGGTLGHDVLLLVEHPHVVTLGRGARQEHVLASTDLLLERGVEVVDVERGGDVTYHGPGQLVGYPILDLTGHRRDLHWYLRRLEEVLLRTVAAFGLPGLRVEGFTGVWTGEAAGGTVESDGFRTVSKADAAGAVPAGEIRKIASIGVHASRWVTSHGFAFNVTREPIEQFDWIVPCGIAGARMTSLEHEGAAATLSDASERLVAEFAAVFDRAVERVEEQELTPGASRAPGPPTPARR